MIKKIIGYTTGVFDLFHVGHLNILKRAKANCDYLIVAVSSDELAHKLKGKWPVIPFEQRAEIVRGIKYVDEVVKEESSDKIVAWYEYRYDILFKGDDAKEKPIYKKYEEELGKIGARVLYFPYTKNISSSKVRVERSGEMEINKELCMSLYLSFRYIEDNNIQFSKGLIHREHQIFPYEKKYPVKTAEDIDYYLQKMFSEIDLSKVGICLSGGMDSAIIASYMPKGTKAYTSRCVADSSIDETIQAKKYCDLLGLEHVIVDVTWNDHLKTMDEAFEWDGEPIVPNEPQAYAMAKKMIEDGVEILIYGANADEEFGGMDKLLSKNWNYDEWKERYSFVNASKVIKNSVDISYVYDRYRVGGNGIDFIRFLREVYSNSAGAAYTNGFSRSGIQYMDPYEHMKMVDPLDLTRIRNGESKYLIRELFKMRYPSIEVPEKLPMSRPADEWLRGWEGPTRSEFIPGCVAGLTGEQKLLVYSLERFLNLVDEKNGK